MKPSPKLAALSLAFAALLWSCETSETRRGSPPPPAGPAEAGEAAPPEIAGARKPPPEKAQRGAVRGQVVPIDESGGEIAFAGRSQAVVSIVPLRDGRRLDDKAQSLTPDEDGAFSVQLREGQYFFEVFLRGFHVRSLVVSVENGKTFDVGRVEVTRIAPGVEKPIQGGGGQEMPSNMGDVNIQPPVS